jgi:hypothetical protein
LLSKSFWIDTVGTVHHTHLGGVAIHMCPSAAVR